MCLARWRCFRILFLRTTFTSVFVTKLYFWCSILLEKCFGLLATKSDYLWAVYHKNQRFTFLCLKYAAFSFIREETCLGLFAVKLVSSQRYCTGKRFSASLQRVMLLFISFCSKERFVCLRLSYVVLCITEQAFPYLPRERVGFGFIAQKTCFGLFALILGCFLCYCTKPDFHSILLKQRFCFLLAKLRCLSIVFLRTTLFSVSVTKLHFGRSILLKNMLWFVCRKIVSSDIAPEKCVLPVCIESLWFLLDFTQNKRFRLFSGKLRCFQDSCLEEQPLPFFVHKLRC